MGKTFINSVTFSFITEFLQIIASTNARRLVVMDAETGEQVLSYDNCKSNKGHVSVSDQPGTSGK